MRWIGLVVLVLVGGSLGNKEVGGCHGVFPLSGPGITWTAVRFFFFFFFLLSLSFPLSLFFFSSIFTFIFQIVWRGWRTKLILHVNFQPQHQTPQLDKVSFSPLNKITHTPHSNSLFLFSFSPFPQKCIKQSSQSQR